MKAHSQEFKNNIKQVRETNAVITYTINNEEITLDGDSILRIKRSINGDILKSIMKQLELKLDREIPKNTTLNLKIGVKVNNNYEYINYGNFVVYEVKKEIETGYYNMLCYDKMLYSMKDYESMGITYPITIRNYINTICNHLGLTFKNINDNFANYNKEIPYELYLTSTGETLSYSFRDVLDELAQVVAGCICINEDDELEIRYPKSVGEYDTKEGSSIEIPNCDDGTNLDLQLQGDTYQQTYSGKNLFNINDITTDGILVRSNTGFTITRSADTRFTKWYDMIYELPAGSYKVISTNSGNYNDTPGIQVRYGSGTVTTFGFYGNNANFTLTSPVNQIRFYLGGGTTVGNYFTSTDLMFVKSDVTDTSYEKFTHGASPNPDYPQPIETVTGRQDVLVCGKNLFDKNHTSIAKQVNINTIEQLSSGIKITYSNVSSGCYVAYNLGTYNQWFGKTINFSSNVVNNTSRSSGLYLWCADNTNLSPLTVLKETYDTGTSFTLSDNYTFNDSSLKNKIVVLVLYKRGTSAVTTSDYTEFNELQIEKGSSKTEYQAYQSNTYEINLGKNLFDKNTNILSNKGLYDNGTTFDSLVSSVKDFMAIEPNTAYTYSGTQDNNYTKRVCYYRTADTSTFVGYNKTTNNVLTFTTPNEARYIRIQFKTSDIDTIQLEKGSQVTSYSAYKTPIELCKIGNYQDSIKKATGKNLFDDNVEKKTAYPITTVGQVVTYNNSSVTSCYVNCAYVEAGKTYTLSYNKNTPANTSDRYGVIVDGSNVVLQQVLTWNNNSEVLLITPTYSGYLILTTDNNATNTMLNEGSTALPYEPYGTNWYIEKKIGKVVLDGSENWYYASSGSDWYEYACSNITIGGKTGYNNCLTNYFNNITNNRCLNNGSTILIRTPDTTITTANDFKTWLSTHNTEVYYILETPTYTEITDTELIEELENVELLEGINNIDIDSGDLPSTIKLTYLAEMDTIDEDYLKNINVTFEEKYGPINSVVLSRTADTDNIYIRDDDSVQENGLCEIKIRNNEILNFNNRDTFLTEIFNKINGLTYHKNDFDTNGILYYDICDIYNVSIGNQKHKCLLLNDSVIIETGMYENIFTEKPDISETDYSKADKTDRRLNQTTLELDKQNSRIKGVAKTITLTTTDNGNSAGIKIQLLNEDGEQIGNDYDADIEMTGKVSFADLSTSNPTKTIINGDNMTTGVIKSSNYVANTSGTKINLSDGTIDSKNFKVNSTGDITATSGTIGGWSMDSVCFSKRVGDYSFEIRSDRTATNPALLVYDTVNGRYNWYVRPDGYMYARNCEINGTVQATSGYIGSSSNGWNIDSSYIYRGGINGSNGARLYADGRLYMKHDYGWVNSGSGGNFINGNGRTYPVWISDQISRQSVRDNSISLELSSANGSTRIATDYDLRLIVEKNNLKIGANDNNTYTGLTEQVHIGSTYFAFYNGIYVGSGTNKYNENVFPVFNIVW